VVANPAAEYVYYLAFDGVDDSLATASINFSATDEMSVFAGVRKLSDAAAGAVVELTASSANPGAISIRAPDGAGLGRYAYASCGTTSVNVARNISAPATNIITGLSKISTDIVTIRVNVTNTFTSNSDQGSGNYASAPLYIGRRGGSSAPFNGRIYSLIVRGLLTSGDLLTATETYVANETGVTI
jgi:hypothetical protein